MSGPFWPRQLFTPVKVTGNPRRRVTPTYIRPTAAQTWYLSLSREVPTPKKLQNSFRKKYEDVNTAVSSVWEMNPVWIHLVGGVQHWFLPVWRSTPNNDVLVFSYGNLNLQKKSYYVLIVIEVSAFVWLWVQWIRHQGKPQASAAFGFKTDYKIKWIIRRDFHSVAVPCRLSAAKKPHSSQLQGQSLRTW